MLKKIPFKKKNKTHTHKKCWTVPKFPCSQGRKGVDLIPACHLARGGVHPEQVTTLHRRQTTTQLLSPKLDYLEGINGGTQREGGEQADAGIELQPFSLRGDGAKSLQQRAAL